MSMQLLQLLCVLVAVSVASASLSFLGGQPPQKTPAATCTVGGHCGAFTACGSEPDCFCGNSTEGEAICAAGGSCDLNQRCLSSSECGVGSFCLRDTCCGYPVCGPRCKIAELFPSPSPTPTPHRHLPTPTPTRHFPTSTPTPTPTRHLPTPTPTRHFPTSTPTPTPTPIRGFPTPTPPPNGSFTCCVYYNTQIEHGSHFCQFAGAACPSIFGYFSLGNITATTCEDCCTF